MALNFNPFGLRPSRMKGGAPNSNGFSRYVIKNNDGQSFHLGDLVKVSTDGFLDRLTNADSPLGVFMGAKWIDPTTKQPTYSKFVVTGTSAYTGVIEAYVLDQPNATFLVQADSSVSQGQVGSYFEVTISASGSDVTGRSKAYLKEASGTTAVSIQAYPFRVVGAWETAENTLGDNNTVVEVVLIGHALG